MKKLLLLCLVVVIVAVQVRAFDYHDSDPQETVSEDTKTCSGNLKDKCCKDFRSTAVSRTIIEDFYLCLSEFVANIFNGLIKFPKPCCKLPVFNFICNNRSAAKKSRCKKKQPKNEDY